MRLKRALLGTGIVLGLTAVFLGAASVLALRYFMPQSDWPAEGRLVAGELLEPVHIGRDILGVPHLLARNAPDGFFALGFTHAQDRLWQMELLRRAARGTLSELFGSTTLGPDRMARTLGLARAAAAEVQRLSERTRLHLEAYSSGVNRYLEEIQAGRSAPPIEMRWLGVAPDPWTPADTLALLRLRAWMLGRSLGASLLLNKLVHEIGGVASRDFFPARTLENGTDRVRRLLGVGEVADAWARVIGLEGRVGSLGFIVGKARSKSGLPILANDPHVAFRLPPVFYLMHLRTPEWEVAGGTWPGVPVFWTGTNRRIAWGQVIVHASVSDLFEQTLHPDDPHRYERVGKWKQADRRVETIAVRGRAFPERIEIVSTEHGPLLGSIDPEDADLRSLALRWAGQGEHSGVETLLRLQEAGAWDQFRSALRRFPGPVATFLYADSRGNLGTQLAGNLPIRSIDTGLLPVPGRSRYYDWRGFMEFDELPSQFGSRIPWRVVGPRPEPTGLPHPVSWLWADGGGSERLRQRLSEARSLGIEDVVAIQRERRSLRGVRVIRDLLGDLEPAAGPARRVHEILLAWEGQTHTDSLGATVYHVFRQRLARSILEARLEPEAAEQVARISEPLPGLLLARFLDRAGPGQSLSLLEAALEQTWSWLTVQVSSNPRRWSWGQIHQLRLRHDFERLGDGWLGWFGRHLGRGPFPVPGDEDSVWTMYQQSFPTGAIGVGPAFRYAIDLADVDHARFGLAGGQSGHPGAQRYDDALRDWLDGRPRVLWMHESDITYRQSGVWELRPISE